MGGSTLTMQLVRIRYGLKTRSISGKTKQILKAVQLEFTYSKKEILEAYLNLAPYGGNVEGAGAASVIYFSKEPKDLVLSEAITLAVIPQKPERILGDGLKKAYQRLLMRWIEKHPEDESKKSLLSLPLNTLRPHQLPFEAPHFVDGLIADHPEESVLRTTLDLNFQHLLERQIQRYIVRRKGIGIQNASALLVDYRTMEIVASVGSADFFDDSIQGQVNGTKSKRSPGSTLKTFVYALAMDQGLVHPLTMLKDSPYSYGGFDPENFDNEFSGPVTVRNALIRSRNIPAVQIASLIEQPDLYGFLGKAGVPLPEPRSHYGMAIVFGGR